MNVSPNIGEVNLLAGKLLASFLREEREGQELEIQICSLQARVRKAARLSWSLGLMVAIWHLLRRKRIGTSSHVKFSKLSVMLRWPLGDSNFGTSSTKTRVPVINDMLVGNGLTVASVLAWGKAG